MTDSSAALADALIAWLGRAGVTEVVVAPGSRNAPLAMALWAAAQQDGGPRLHTRIDERTAAFLGLGLTKSGARAAVLTTSGTAVANLHPAVLEAVHAGVGLIVVSADRPARLRGTGANQTTDQVGIFGGLVTTHDIDTVAQLDAVAAPWDSVVHLNVQLDTPLVPDVPVVPDV
ncbi:thiamine pyrophosphate-binding protein, partial [Nocardioides ginsengisoli]